MKRSNVWAARAGRRILCLLLTVLLFLSLLGFALPGLTPLWDGRTGQTALPAQAIKGAYRDLSAQIAGDGSVLLKNDGTLPLAKGSVVSLFGSAQINVLIGGGGSSVMFTDYSVTPLEGLRSLASKGRIRLNETLATAYEDYLGQRSEILATWGENAFDKDNVDQAYASAEMPLTEDMVADAAGNSDTAVFMLTRFATEGDDLHAVPGEYYLSEIETENLRLICKYFTRVIAVLNIPCPLDSSWFGGKSPTFPINSVLSVWYPGEEAGNVLADLLCGNVNPAGKLTVTMARDYNDYLTAANFDQQQNVFYEEDIFVGYRQFETFDPTYETVHYEFGFGLSYTTFTVETLEVSEAEGQLKAKVRVTNSGKMAGREVVQLYYSAPQGILGKPARELAAFAKTDLLQPGKSQVLTLSFDIDDMSSYDDTGKVAKSAYVLEAGDYTLYLGTSIRDAGERGSVYTYTVPELRITEQLTERSAPTRLTQRLLADGTYETLEPRRARIDTAISGRVNGLTAGTEAENSAEGYTPPEDGAEPFTLLDLARDPSEQNWDRFLAQLTVQEMARIAGGQPSNTSYAAGGMFGYVLEKYWCPSIDVTDGSVGVRVLSTATYFPSGICLASTWDVALAHRFGSAVGHEAAMSDISVWLGPGMNLIRNPLCGRNFEYSSEDPLLTGRIAAAITRGVQSWDVGVTLKHYFANNKEAGRGPSDSQLSERAARELYLKSFEICVREANPWGIMTTCGTVNGQGVAGNYDYMTAIPREEWGFTGFFMSDWANMDNEQRELNAGHNISMPKSNPDVLINAFDRGEITRAQLEDNTYWLLSNLMRLHSFKRMVDPNTTVQLAPGRNTQLQLHAFYWSDGYYQFEQDSRDSQGNKDGVHLASLQYGATFLYRIHAELDGTYQFSTRFASLSGTGGYDLYIDDELVYSFSVRKEMKNTDPHSWYIWTDSSAVPLTLSAGDHEVRLYVTGDGFNLSALHIRAPYSTAQIVGFVALGVCGAILIASVIVLIAVRHKRKRQHSSKSTTAEAQAQAEADNG